MQTPTVAIADNTAPGGFRLINESDFDSDQHKRFEGKNVPKQADIATELEPTAPKPTVQPSDRLDGLTMTQLRAIAQAEDVKGRSSMDQEELIQALEKKGYER